MKQMQTNIGKAENQLRHWGTRIDDLVSRLEEAGTTVEDGYRQSVRDLQSKHQITRVKLDELRAAGSEMWQAYKAGVDAACSDFGVAYEQLKRS